MLAFINRLMTAVEEFIVTALIFSATIITIIQIIARYVFNDSIFWSEEFILFALISMSFFSMSMGLRHATHIKVEVLYAFSSPAVIRVLNIVEIVFGMLFSFTVTYYGYRLAINTLNMGQLTPAMQIPMGYIYFAIPISSFLLLMRYVLRLLYFFGIDEDGQTITSLEV